MNSKSKSGIKELDDSIYDFDQSDEDGIKLVLFPDDNEENKVKGAKKYTGIKRKRTATDEIGERKKAKIHKRVLKSKDGNVKLMFEKLNEKKNAKTNKVEKEAIKANAQRKGNKTKAVSQTREQKKMPDKSKQLESRSSKITGESRDSGVLETPLLRSSRRKRQTCDDMSQATSTPSPLSLNAKKAKSTPKEYEPLLMPSPMLSPVMKMSPIDFSPKKHKQVDRVAEASSPDFKSPKPGRIFGSFGLSTKEPYTVMLCPSCVVVLCWHRHWHLCTPPPGTGLDIETSYLVHICPPFMHIKYLVILTHSF